MAFSRTFTDQTYDCEITFESDGWSGEPVICDEGGPTGNTRFQFDITARSTNNSDEYYTAQPSPGNYGYWHYAGSEFVGAILGLSLEHMGRAVDTDSEIAFQGVGCHPNWGMAKCWGAKPSDTELTVRCNSIGVHSLDLDLNGEPSVYEDETLGRYYQYRNNQGIIFWRCQYVWSGEGTFRATIKTDLPIFETDADLLAYCQSGGTDTSKILNKASVDPEEEYEDARKFKYVRNIYGHNANNPTQHTGYRNYRFYGGDGKICFYVTQPSSGHPFTLKLFNYSSYTVKEAGIYEYDTESYTDVSGDPAVDYLNTSIQFSSSNWYECFQWDADILIFGSLGEAEMWRDDLIDARQALNFDKVSKAYNEIVDPEYGNPDAGYDNGYNGQSYVNGARMWVMTSTELNNFFDDIFDPNMIDQLLEGTKLFGSQEIQAIQGISYFPIDIDEVANVYGSAHPIKIGNFTCPTATGRYVINNNKLINCGSVFIKPVYNDFRDYHMKLFIQLPYVGTHELNISKFLHHNLEVFYAVDVSTGGCTAHVLADGISYGDSYDGFMASQRPLTALDQTSYLNSVMGCVSTMVDRQSGLINSAANAIAGAATGHPSGGGGGFHGPQAAFNGIKDTFALQQAIKDYPMSSRGGFAGCLGFFGNQQIHIITVQSKTVKPSLEQQLVGYPSHVSQRIGNFSGYLRCSAVNLNNFPGTAQELADIHNLLANGIYLN